MANMDLSEVTGSRIRSYIMFKKEENHKRAIDNMIWVQKLALWVGPLLEKNLKILKSTHVYSTIN